MDHHVATIGVDFRSVVTMNKGKIVLLELVSKGMNNGKW